MRVISERWISCYAKWDSRREQYAGLDSTAAVICKLIEELSEAEMLLESADIHGPKAPVPSSADESLQVKVRSCNRHHDCD